MTDISAPAASFLLMTYNQQDYITDAVRAALLQTYPNLHIILSDDCSKDKTFERMEKLVADYDGPHHVTLNRNPQNIGVAAHVNWMVGASTGDYFVLAAGDDISDPERTSKSIAYLVENPDVHMVSMTTQTIDKTGTVTKPAHAGDIRCLTVDSYFDRRPFHPNGASRTHRRSVLDVFGPLNPSCPTEDTPFLLRAMLLGEVAEIPDMGVSYRRHGKNLSTTDNIARMNLQEILNQYRADIATGQAAGLYDAARRDHLDSMVSDYIYHRLATATALKKSASPLKKLAHGVRKFGKSVTSRDG